MPHDTRTDDRADHYCRNCGYELRGLPFRGKCPECGERYVRRPAAIEEEPDWFKEHQKRWRWWQFYRAAISLDPIGRGDVLCRGCAYSLKGLGVRGECPECGALYDKGTGRGIKRSLPPDSEAALALKRHKARLITEAIILAIAAFMLFCVFLCLGGWKGLVTFAVLAVVALIWAFGAGWISIDRGAGESEP